MLILYTQLLRSGGTRLMEPFMRVEISIDGNYLHAVLADFSQHRADILDVTERNEVKVGCIHYNLSID